MNKFLSLLFVGLLTVFIGTNAAAQQTGTLSGQVVDSFGAVVVGASVTVIDSNGKEKTVVTNRQGEYSIGGLTPGKYTVRVSAATFEPYENTEVEIGIGRQEFVVSLTAAAIEETVEVGDENQVNTDADSNRSATVLKGEDIEALPDDPDELEAALQALAGPSAGPNGGQIYIDGFTGGRMPPRDAIREIRINQNPFSAEFERMGFGRIEILTKPGSDRWRGQAFFNFNDESLNSRNPFAPNRAPTQQKTFGGNVSGPLQKGKSSFFIDISNRQVDNNAVINALVLDQNLNVVPFQEDVTLPTRRFSISPRFDYQLNQNHTLIARYSFTRFSADNQGIGGFSLPSRVSSSRNTEHTVQLTETAIINPKTINETRFQINFNDRKQEGDNSIPTISVASAFTGGGAQVGLSFSRNWRWEVTNNTTTSFGKNSQHAVKFGVRVRGVSLKDRSENNFGGTYTFTSINEYRDTVLGLATPTQFSINAGNPEQSVSQYDLGAFITDDWRVRPDLTLSFGLRYENQTNISDNLNFAPRFSFAWSPGAGGARQPKTVFRGGFGIFYDRFGENYALQELRFNGVNQMNYIVSINNSDETIRQIALSLLSQPVFTYNGVTNSLTVEQIAAVLPGSFTIRRVASDLQAPYTIQTALGVERQLPFRTTLSAFFINGRSLHQLRTRNINAPICPPYPQSCDGAQRPDMSLNQVYQYESSGVINQQQLIINFNSRLNPRFTIWGNYRLGRAKGDTDGAGTFPAYTYDLSGEYGASSLDVRHNMFLGGSFTLPFGIRMMPFVIASSGRPFNITLGEDRNNDLLFTERPTFAELNAACVLRGLTYSWCEIGDNDPNAIIPRNYGRGPSFFNVNLNLSKTFGFGGNRRSTTAGRGGQGDQQGNPRVGGGGPRGGFGGGPRGGFGGGPRGGGFGGGSDSPYNLTVGLQISNLLNRTNLGTPVGNINSRLFGESTSTAGGFGFFGGGGSSSANRRIELQMRFSW